MLNLLKMLMPYYPYGFIGVQTIVAPGTISFHVITPTSPVPNVIAVAGASMLAVPTILTDPLRIIKLFPDAAISALPETVTVPVPRVSGFLDASRFAVPTIVTVPTPSVNGFDLHFLEQRLLQY